MSTQDETTRIMQRQPDMPSAYGGRLTFPPRGDWLDSDAFWGMLRDRGAVARRKVAARRALAALDAVEHHEATMRLFDQEG